jgi:type I restriction enzyme S subunit
VQGTDLVMVRYGTPGLLVSGIKGIIANNLFQIKVQDASITNEFLSYFLNQRIVQTFLQNQGSSTMPALTFKHLGQVVVSFPSLITEQDDVVSQLDAIADETQLLAQPYERKLNNLSKLKQSLLQKAFTGELTADPKVVDRALSEASL